jgi:hypothetical protein
MALPPALSELINSYQAGDQADDGYDERDQETRVWEWIVGCAGPSKPDLA